MARVGADVYSLVGSISTQKKKRKKKQSDAFSAKIVVKTSMAELPVRPTDLGSDFGVTILYLCSTSCLEMRSYDLRWDVLSLCLNPRLSRSQEDKT